ncbi:hypothetical protein C1J00_09055 [Streptomyces cahuitamycinicus]|uniref:RHS repeat-associated core domain-containing protein n=1 Tax=Streptomyces cahuitamycinicus TaxID=2070367 RepID=A0A2N8TU08_9ACTN|nr:hypothetical protein C1J00_09055 [Streptomyces cahuitamycinicus]
MVNHYDSDDDIPRWIVENTTTGAVTRNVQSVARGLAATTGKSGDTVLQLTDLHGDVSLQLPLNAAQAPVALDNDEYGNPRTGQAAPRYGWLGEAQRSAETLTGLTLMGVRLYDPARGRFLQTDPVPGGSANAYDYSNADPCNATDTDGMSPKCGKRGSKMGTGCASSSADGAAVPRRTATPHRLLHQRPDHGVPQPLRGVLQRHLWGDARWPPGQARQDAQVAGQGKLEGPRQDRLGGPLQRPGEARTRIGTRIWTYGAVMVSGFNGYMADMSYSCMAK